MEKAKKQIDETTCQYDYRSRAWVEASMRYVNLQAFVRRPMDFHVEYWRDFLFVEGAKTAHLAPTTDRLLPPNKFD